MIFILPLHAGSSSFQSAALEEKKTEALKSGEHVWNPKMDFIYFWDVQDKIIFQSAVSTVKENYHRPVLKTSVKPDEWESTWSKQDTEALIYMINTQ